MHIIIYIQLSVTWQLLSTRRYWLPTDH